MKNFLRILVLTISVLIVSVPVFASSTLLGAYDTMLISENYNSYLGYDTSIANGFDLNSIKVQINGEFVDFTDSDGNKVEPQIINDRTMVPMRKIFEEFGAEIEWIDGTKSIIATTADKEIGLQINNSKAIVKNANGETEIITLDSVPVIVEGRTLVPVRFIAESLDKIVGWDQENRAVVIVEPALISEKIQAEASNLYEYLTLDLEKVTTSTTQSDITGKVKYEDVKNSINNSTLNLVGNAEINTSEVAMQLDLDLNITGKGILMTTVKEEGLEEIDLTMIVDFENGYMYISSNLLGEEMNGKWARYEFEDSEKTLLKSSISQSSNMDALVASLIQEENLILGSYEELNMTLDLIVALMGDDNFTSSGRTTKTYNYEITLEEVLEALGYSTAEIAEIDEAYDFEMSSEIKVADKVAKESDTTIKFGMVYENEELEAEVKTETVLESYNEKVEIKIPSNNDIVVVE